MAETGTIERKKGSGRPTVVNDQTRTTIEQRLNDDDETFTEQLQNVLEGNWISISRSSIRRSRMQLGWTYRKSAYCQLIRERNKVKRLEWAKKCIDEGTTFKNVIFTDETSVQLDCYRRFSYRKVGQLPRPKPRYTTQCTTC